MDLNNGGRWTPGASVLPLPPPDECFQDAGVLCVPRTSVMMAPLGVHLGRCGQLRKALPFMCFPSLPASSLLSLQSCLLKIAPAVKAERLCGWRLG